MECPHCYSQVKAHSTRCAACGGFIPPGQHLLEEAGLAKPRLLPSPPPPSPRSSSSQELAKLTDRFLAFVLDTAVLFGIFAVADAWIFMRWGSVEKLQLNLTTASLVLALTLNTLILFAYGWLLEAGFGATLGKTIVGLRVVRTGHRSALAASAIRNLLRLVDGLGCYLVGAMFAGCSRWRQRLGDLSAGTTVVEEQYTIVAKMLALTLGMAVMFAAAWEVPRICSEQNVPQHTRYLDQVLVQVGKRDNAAYFRVARLQFDIQLDPKQSSVNR